MALPIRYLCGVALNYLNQVQISANTSSRNRAKSIIQRFPSKKIAGIITTVASLSFGVYLLQDHAIIRSILWNDWVCLAEVVDCGGLFLFRVVLIVAILFVAGIVVEFVRRKIMGCLALGNL